MLEGALLLIFIKMNKDLRRVVEISEDTEVLINGNEVNVKGNGKELKRNFDIGKIKAKVIKLYDKCNIGDFVAKYDNLEVPQFTKITPAVSEYDSYIIAKSKKTMYLAPFDFVFVNKTKDMKIGQVYQIIKENVITYDPLKQTTVKLPYLSVGTIKILRIDQHTATAIVNELYDNSVGKNEKLTLFSEAY
jgi:hypothetical protein